MIALDSPRWGELIHAYGPASDTPGLLARLADDPTDADAWDELRGSLIHQYTVYQAALAAVPHVLVLATRNEGDMRLELVEFIACVALYAYPDDANELWCECARGSEPTRRRTVRGDR